MDNDFLKMLRERRSVRSFKSEQISDDELNAVLEAGTYAPTGMNYQDPWIVAVQNPDLVQRLSRMNAAVMNTDSDPYYGAPTIVLVFASRPEKWPNGMADGSLVLGNMMNAAHAIGLGSCWINREREMFDTDEGRELLRQFGLPDSLMGVGALALGYPAAPARPARPRKDNYYRVVR
ncbi:MAG: nitroreductase [Bacteroidales bacterium]|nr:nitroreductase [Bacteroidales bacterium]